MTSLPGSPLKSHPQHHRPAPEDGAALLDAVEAHHRRFIAFPDDAAAVAVTLWVAHTHLLDAFESTPRLAFLSEPGSGKTRALAVTGDLAPRAHAASGGSSATLVRAVSGPGVRPTVLLDDINNLARSRTTASEELRGLINAGHRRTGTVLRCTGRDHTQEVQALPVYFALAIASTNDLPNAVMSRSVVIRMRRASGASVADYNPRRADGHALRDRLATWADSVRDELDVWPELPDGINDRPADVWEPLLAVADAAGGHWPERARAACVQLTTASNAPTGQAG
ncbi:DUF3631 domain-containing protein [Kitasatospora sp. NPDC059646]|uniref:DUF3631 domain-containing protein n=1 Tax=Kitasatospora sp. NPDC059646 TaxID=3346893 RepID=UPI0036BBCA22